MNSRALSVLVGILIVVAPPLAGADEKPAGDPHKAAVLKKSDARILLEAGQTTGSLPKGVVVHLSANMTRVSSQSRKHGAASKKPSRKSGSSLPTASTESQKSPLKTAATRPTNVPSHSPSTPAAFARNCSTAGY
jgi:hypothetical protein